MSSKEKNPNIALGYIAAPACKHTCSRSHTVLVEGVCPAQLHVLERPINQSRFQTIWSSLSYSFIKGEAARETREQTLSMTLGTMSSFFFESLETPSAKKLEFGAMPNQLTVYSESSPEPSPFLSVSIATKVS